jgi:Ca2+-binding RTX toxin-like protein
VRARADLDLIAGIAALPDPALSSEGHLYAGAAILGLVQQITVTNGHPELLDPITLARITGSALSHLEQGQIEPDASEVLAASTWLEQAATALGGVVPPGYIENGTAGPDLLIGNSGPNLLVGSGGNDALFGQGGRDILLGGEGSDWLLGGAGADYLDGGASFDFASYETASSGVVARLSTLTSGPGSEDALINVEGLVGSAHNDILIGDASVNILAGIGGDDVLVAIGGNDALIGGPGRDTFGIAGGGTTTQILDFDQSDVISFAGRGLHFSSCRSLTRTVEP